MEQSFAAVLNGSSSRQVDAAASGSVKPSPAVVGPFSTDGSQKPPDTMIGPAESLRSKRRVRLAMGPVVLAVVLAISMLLLVRDDSSPQSQARAGASRTIDIYNKVTSGNEVREDSVGFLSTRPVNFCKRDGCMLEGTDVLTTGVTVTAVCQTLGARTTNGEDNNSADDRNPELFESRLWYGIRWSDGRFGFFPEVWVHRDDRGGLDLPLC